MRKIYIALVMSLLSVVSLYAKNFVRWDSLNLRDTFVIYDKDSARLDRTDNEVLLEVDRVCSVSENSLKSQGFIIEKRESPEQVIFTPSNSDVMLAAKLFNDSGCVAIMYRRLDNNVFTWVYYKTSKGYFSKLISYKKVYILDDTNR